MHVLQSCCFRLWHRRNLLDLVSWDPFDDDPFDFEFFHSHELYFPRIHFARTGYQVVPHTLVTRNDKHTYQLSVDVKGFDPKDLSLKLVGRELVITGNHICRQNQNVPCFHKQFCWRRTLPEDVDLSSLKATLTEKNVLEIDANKRDKAKESDIQIAVRERPGDQIQHKPKKQFEHVPSVRQEPSKVDEEATVEIVPDDTETK